MNKIKKIAIVLLVLCITIFSVVVSSAKSSMGILHGTDPADYKYGENNKYTFRTTKTAESIFKNAESNPSGYLGQKISMGLAQSMISTDIVYCVSHGTKMTSQYLTDYTITGYVDIDGSTATIYENGKATRTYTGNIVKMMAAAVAKDGPNAGKLGYGAGENMYSKAQYSVYSIWDEFATSIGCSKWKGNNKLSTNAAYYASILKYITENPGKEFKAQIFFLESKGSVNSQSLILAQGETTESTTTELTIQKVWEDEDNKYNSRSNIKVSVYRNDDLIKTVELTSENNYTVKLEGLPGKFEEYKVVEPELADYDQKSIETDKETKTIKITNKLKDISITVKKVWEDGGTGRPISITVRLTNKKTGEVKVGQITAASGWAPLTFTGLTGSVEDYEVSEDKVSGYEDGWISSYEHSIRVANYTITNVEEPEPDNPQNANGKVKISGYVFEDAWSGKSSVFNGIMEDGDKKISGIKVNWKTATGKVIASTTTNKDGYYEMYTDSPIKNHPYNINLIKYLELNTSYVEFEYNAYEYTTTIADLVGVSEKTSKATENAEQRTAINNKFDEITNKGVIDNGSVAYDLVYDRTLNQSTVNVSKSGLKNCTITATTKGLAGFSLLGTVNSNATEITPVYKYTTSSKSGKIYCHEHCIKGHIFNSDGTTSEGSHIRAIESILKGLAALFGEANKVITYCTDPECVSFSHCLLSGKYEDVDTWEISNVNLGLVKREQPDLSLASDIEKVEVVMKNQNYTYLYGKRGIQNAEDGLFDFAVKFSGKYSSEYIRKVNPADIAYLKQNDPNEMEVYVTYNIVAKNNSTTMPVKVNEIINYYDANYTLCDLVNWKPVLSENLLVGYKAATTNLLKDEVIQPNSKSSIISVKYKVNIESVLDDLIGEKGNVSLKNISEISSYTTQYGEYTLYSNGLLAGVVGKTGEQYSGIDKDSQPKNVSLVEAGTGTVSIGGINLGNIILEDDTDVAPVFKLQRDSNYRIISGTVWEDSQTDESKAIKERTGDGKYNKDEKYVEGVRVELVKTDENGKIKYNDDGTAEIANIYKVENGKVVTEPAVTYTDNKGRFSFGSTDTKGVIEDYYTVRYIYGNKETFDNSGVGHISKIDGTTEVNARDYKSTIIPDGLVKELFKGSKQDDKWHINVSTSEITSTAIDDLTERDKIDDLIYDNYENGVNMTAYSNPFRLQLEYTKNQQAQVEADGSNPEFKLEVSTFNFGIIRRAEEKMIIDKTITNIRITLSNGQILVDGDPYNDKLNYVVALGPKDKLTTADNRERLIRIEMDTELIQNAELYVEYAITVTNNSEVDYEHDNNAGKNYYFYGEKDSSSLKLVNNSAELVADYMDSEFIFNDKINEGWSIATAESLREQGLISENTKQALLDGDYKIVVTDAFKEVKPGESLTKKLYVTKLLANKADDYTFENHSEILKLNSNMARTTEITTNLFGKETVVKKSYKPGNYVPGLANRKLNTDTSLEQAGLHENDDDRIVIRLTPPTGVNINAIIYSVIALIALIVIIGGIFIIRKKVLPSVDNSNK